MTKHVLLSFVYCKPWQLCMQLLFSVHGLLASFQSHFKCIRVCWVCVWQSLGKREWCSICVAPVRGFEKLPPLQVGLTSGQGQANHCLCNSLLKSWKTCWAGIFEEEWDMRKTIMQTVSVRREVRRHARATIALQPMVRWQTESLQPSEVNGGAESHWQPMEDPTVLRKGCVGVLCHLRTTAHGRDQHW